MQISVKHIPNDTIYDCLKFDTTKRSYFSIFTLNLNSPSKVQEGHPPK